MQILVALVFLVVWLLILWIGSIALESTGLERGKSRFQALSALTGTGFTTTQAEAIVENTKRRKIVTYLILLGNTGIVAFIILVVMYARSGIAAPSIFLIAITVVVILVIVLSIRLRLVDKLTNVILKLTGKGNDVSRLMIEKVLHQTGDYALVQMTVGKRADIAGSNLKDTDFQRYEITVLAIERGEKTLAQPGFEEQLQAGDHLLCYGKSTSINDIAGEK
jgi:hypothetical protein